MGPELSSGQKSDGHRLTQTETMTIPGGQYWPQVKGIRNGSPSIECTATCSLLHWPVGCPDLPGRRTASCRSYPGVCFAEHRTHQAHYWTYVTHSPSCPGLQSPPTWTGIPALQARCFYRHHLGKTRIKHASNFFDKAGPDILADSPRKVKLSVRLT